MPTLPGFLIKKIPKSSNIKKIRELLCGISIETVCESAHCPNIGECFSKNTLTFMILGDTCMRTCAFCGVLKGEPKPVDLDEPQKIKETVSLLGLKYVVVTSVTRDDLPDFGANQFAKVIRELKPIPVEVLIPDLQGKVEMLKKILDEKPIVLNHNMETVKRLYVEIRPQAKYGRSLALLQKSKELAPDIYTKSGFMVGLGESDDEVLGVLNDLKCVGCDIVTIGQYLPPSKDHQAPKRYVDPAIFDSFKKFGEGLGIKHVFSGPFVRSSYKAEEILC